MPTRITPTLASIPPLRCTRSEAGHCCSGRRWAPRSASAVSSRSSKRRCIGGVRSAGVGRAAWLCARSARNGCASACTAVHLRAADLCIDPSARGSNRVCACAAVAGRRAVCRHATGNVHARARLDGVCSARHAHRQEQELPVGEALSAGAEGRGGNGGGGGGVPLCWIECEQLREQVERTCAPQRSHAARCAK
jgi:hypothetical protein